MAKVKTDSEYRARCIAIKMVLVLILLLIVQPKIFTKEVKIEVPVITTGVAYELDFKTYTIGSDVYKLNTDGTASKRVLKGIFARKSGVRYRLEWCVEEIFESRELDVDTGEYKKTKIVKCGGSEEVALIGNTEEELYAQLCSKSSCK